MDQNLFVGTSRMLSRLPNSEKEYVFLQTTFSQWWCNTSAVCGRRRYMTSISLRSCYRICTDSIYRLTFSTNLKRTTLTIDHNFVIHCVVNSGVDGRTKHKLTSQRLEKKKKEKKIGNRKQPSYNDSLPRQRRTIHSWQDRQWQHNDWWC